MRRHHGGSCPTIPPVEIARTRLSCPECAQPLSRVGDDDPWCTSCEWNLLGPASKMATRLDQVLFEEFSRERPVKPGRTPAGVTLVIVSVLLGLVPFGLLGWGLWLLWSGSWVVGGIAAGTRVPVAPTAREGAGQGLPAET
jgi:heat shock protein HtpX